MLGGSWTLLLVWWSWDRNGSGVPASKQNCAVLLSCHASVVSRVPMQCEEGMCFWLEVLVCWLAGNTVTVTHSVLQWIDKLKDAEVVYHLLSD